MQQMKEKLIDLHTHSTMSDGSLTPEELVVHAHESRLSAIALTDHDNIDGVKRAKQQGEKCGIEVVAGIELSVKCATQNHILGLLIDVDNSELNGELDSILQRRVERNAVTCRKLNDLGFEVSLDEARAIAPGGIVGRAHFARLMMNKGYVESVKEAFDKYLAVGKPAYFSNQELSAERAIELIHGAGGVAVMAHPHQMKLSDEATQEYMAQMKEYGLDAVEGYYSEYTDEMQSKYCAMAKNLGLALSGGSDFHGSMKPHIAIGKGFGNLSIPYSVLEGLKSVCERRN